MEAPDLSHSARRENNQSQRLGRNAKTLTESIIHGGKFEGLNPSSGQLKGPRSSIQALNSAAFMILLSAAPSPTPFDNKLCIPAQFSGVMAERPFPPKGVGLATPLRGVPGAMVLSPIFLRKLRNMRRKVRAYLSAEHSDKR